jgi:hypothetical protein
MDEIAIHCTSGGIGLSLKSFLKKWLLRVSSVVLPVSIVFVAVSLTLLMLGDFRLPPFVLSAVCFASAAFIWFAAFQMLNRARFSFAATFLTLTGVFLLLVDIRSITLSLRLIWPIIMFFVGISFFVAGLFRYRRLHAVFMAPAVVFCALGLVFLLFSTHFLQFSFIPAFLWWFPFLLLPVIAFFIWFVRKHAGDRDAKE